MDDPTLWILGFMIVTLQALNGYLTGRMGASVGGVATVLRNGGGLSDPTHLGDKVDALGEHLLEIQNILGDLTDAVEEMGVSGGMLSQPAPSSSGNSDSETVGDIIKTALLSRIVTGFSDATQFQGPVHTDQETPNYQTQNFLPDEETPERQGDSPHQDGSEPGSDEQTPE